MVITGCGSGGVFLGVLCVCVCVCVCLKNLYIVDLLLFCYYFASVVTVLNLVLSKHPKIAYLKKQ